MSYIVQKINFHLPFQRPLKETRNLLFINIFINYMKCGKYNFNINYLRKKNVIIIIQYSIFLYIFERIHIYEV